jgi:acetylornithine/LysW-gamma-L-lysine aminotransferase
VDYAETEKNFEFDVYPKRDVVLVRGENARIWDDKGKEYIDCVCGHGVANLGHAHPVIKKVIEEQTGRLITCSNVFYNDQKAILLEKLVRISPAGLTRAFLCNSGTESIEAAIKFARFATGKTDFICAMRSFHGRTMGALSATFKPEYRKAFEPLVPGFHFVPFNNFEKLQEKVTDRTAGILLEPIQGEGGVHIADKDFLVKVRELCHQRGILLLIDEIQTGFCRTGRFFACEHFDLQPDIMCLAKAIAGGLPMGAVLCSDKISVPVGKHGTTFGGNPLCCAAANATIDFMLANRMAEQAEEKGVYLANKLQEHDLARVRAIRQIGLMIGIEVKEKVVPMVLQMLEAGILVFPAGATVLRVYPPLTIEYELLDVVAEKLVSVLKS